MDDDDFRKVPENTLGEWDHDLLAGKEDVEDQQQILELEASPDEEREDEVEEEQQPQQQEGGGEQPVGGDMAPPQLVSLPPLDLRSRDPKELEPRLARPRDLQGEIDELLHHIVAREPRSANEFAATFTGDLAPLQGAARQTYEAVQKLGQVKLKGTEKVAKWHAENYSWFQQRSEDYSASMKEKRKLKPNTKKKFNPLISAGHIFWGDYGRSKRSIKREKKRGGVGGDNSELLPGQKTLLSYRARVVEKIKPMLLPLLSQIRQVCESRACILPPKFADELAGIFVKRLGDEKVFKDLL